VLPDEEIIPELEAHGQVFRTDLDDTACAVKPAKVGPDSDGQPGGCDNVRLTITGTMINRSTFGAVNRRLTTNVSVPTGVNWRQMSLYFTCWEAKKNKTLD